MSGSAWPHGSVVTMGETMALLDAPASGRLGSGSSLPLGIGGAESGDAFVAGYLSEVIAGAAVPERLRMGNTVAAAVCGVRGDWEGLPTRNELGERPSTADVLR